MACPFCTNPEIKARLIYQDDLVMAFPTNIPITPGHMLVCPTRHLATVDELSDAEWLAIRTFVIRLKIALQKSVAAEGFNLAWNEGELAGQSVPHLHLHVVPRTTGDEGIYQYEPRQFLYRPGSRETSPESELQTVATLVKSKL